MKTVLLLLFAIASVPVVSAGPVETCTAVTPIFDYDPVACVNEAYASLGVINTIGNIVLDALCPYERLLYDDMVGGPFEGARCLRLPIEN